ncbi:AAA ATPase-like protein [Mangrovibacterium diazotrophicum]|uniref:AAA ATPase-like protein n=2 Tax=Mangrovibacterium diazotrophicum TaxID=1261403 RepID=A0A419W3M3_9BACT|nr:AAA ATPase-like protein [Mangrovibacterium diazotrophicum]
MVGKNNSGKSTIVKALLLVLDYLRNQQKDTFSFASEVLNDANIVTYERALCQNSESGFIDFHFEIEDYSVEISLWPEEDADYTFANVHTVKITDEKNKIDFLFDHVSEFVRISKQVSYAVGEMAIEIVIDNIRESVIKYKKELEGVSKTSREGLNLINQINLLNMRLDELESRPRRTNDTEIKYNLDYPLKDFTIASTEESPLEEMVSDFLSRNHDLRVFYIGKREDSSVLVNEENEQFEQINAIDADRHNIKNSISKFVNLLNTKKVFYLGANPSKQSALFYLRDKQNALGQAIHQFYQLKIQKGQPEYIFVEKWMKRFEIGDTFDINFISGEAYECFIKNGDVETHLADMGMGSLQLMQLFFKIATMLRHFKAETKGINLIVEEPELNLHPALQSELADFFFEINDEFGIKFIVETHSEYIIRRTQVLGLKNGLFTTQETNPNPFTVYYFHLTEGPYQMNYTAEGKFDRSFDGGFTNVATNSTKEMLKLNRHVR